MDDGLNILAGPEGLRVKFEAAARRIIKVDVERYQAYLDGTDFTDQQKQEFLQAMWLVMISFVELGFEVHPIQDACGKNSTFDKDCTAKEPNAVVLSEPKTNEINQEPHL